MSELPEIATRYDRNADRYDDVARYNREAAERLVRALPPGDYGSLLDVGCGTGFATIAMVERFATAAVTGVDISSQMLERMRAKLAALPEVEAELHVADVLAMPAPDAAYDCVLASMALHWFPQRAEAIAAMARKVAPGGVLGLVAPGPGHDFEFTEVLRTVSPPLPPPAIEVFFTAEIFPDDVEEQLAVAGLEPIDIWVETRRRRVSPERYMARITTVGSHVWTQIMSPADAGAMVERVTAALEEAAGSRGFEYTFTKTYAIARRPR